MLGRRGKVCCHRHKKVCKFSQLCRAISSLATDGSLSKISNNFATLLACISALSFTTGSPSALCVGSGFRGHLVEFGRNVLELLVYYLMLNKCKNLKDMKSSCFLFVLVAFKTTKVDISCIITCRSRPYCSNSITCIRIYHAKKKNHDHAKY